MISPVLLFVGTIFLSIAIIALTLHWIFRPRNKKLEEPLKNSIDGNYRIRYDEDGSYYGEYEYKDGKWEKVLFKSYWIRKNTLEEAEQILKEYIEHLQKLSNSNGIIKIITVETKKAEENPLTFTKK